MARPSGRIVDERELGGRDAQVAPARSSTRMLALVAAGPHHAGHAALVLVGGRRALGQRLHAVEVHLPPVGAPG
jgi:hypothetical protein